MKKILALVLCLIMALALVACATPAEPEEPAGDDQPVADDQPVDEEKPLVGITVPNSPTGWVAAVQWGAKAKAEELGLNYVLVAANDVNEQANHVDELIQMGCEIIVMMPQNDELAVAGQKIMDAGITLVNFDRTLGTTEPDYYVAGNNTQMGVLGGEYIMEKLGEAGGKVAILNIPGYGAIFTERVDGFKATVADHPEIEIIGEWGVENGAPETVLPVMTDILTANPQIDAIYSTDDEMSIGILQAVKEAGRTDIKVITGGGGAQIWFAKFADEQDIWLSSQTYAPYMINDAVELAAGLLEGKEYEARTIIDAWCVDRDNVQEYLDTYGITEDAPY